VCTGEAGSHNARSVEVGIGQSYSVSTEGTAKGAFASDYGLR
jgi:hypothetical protein